MRLIVAAEGAPAVRSRPVVHRYSPIEDRAKERLSMMERSAPCARGFTLIEVMIVVVILGLLAAIIVPKVMSRPDEARAVAAKADIAAINQALKLYRLDNTFYPSTEQGLQALVTRPATQPVPNNWKQGGYLDRVPKDPWGREYLYLNPGARGEIDVFSFGADGQAGGEGSNADIYL
jgi:general secretion pathway protein G